MIVSFLDKNIFDSLKKQIESFVIDITKNKNHIKPADHIIRHVFEQIFSIFTNLKYLKFTPSTMWDRPLFYNYSLPTVYSSILLELHVYVKSFSDCLYLLDGRFDQLQTFHVRIFMIRPQPTTIINQVDDQC